MITRTLLLMRIQIMKCEPLYKLLEWKIEHANGKALLKSISADDAELRRLLGAEYTNSLSALRGTPSASAPAASNSAAASAPARSATTALGLAASRLVVPVQPALLSAAPLTGPARLVAPSDGSQPPANISASTGSPALLQQAQLPPNDITALTRVQDGETSNAAAASAPAVGAGAGTGGEPPAKKRKMMPVDQDDIIDLT